MENLNGQMNLNGQLKGYIQEHDRISKSGSSSSSSSPSSMPHLPYEKSKMIDITRDKPIKIAVRVAVPVRDHPKFNFVGKLLGPKGNSLKRLQEETMCKMSVLGRGSMRDRKKEEELRLSGEYKYSHLSEDLHVEISTFSPPAEAHARIAYALAEVRRFLVPDHHDDIRQEQKWEMQALSSTSSVDEVASEPNGNEESTDTTATTANNCGGDDSGLQTNNSNSLNINNNTIAINNNNCDTIKNNNNQCTTQTTTTATTPPAAALKLLNDVEAVPAIALIEHQNPLLRSVNISSLHTTAGTICRKRPLMCNTRNLNNPTKRTVMTLLARAKTANAFHGFHPLGPSITDSLQLLTSPLIIPQTLEHVLQAGTTNPQSIKQENLLQGV
ncbi:unnamed protein product [Diamesa tonsa]